ncbi:PA0069 family radical SAM protein [Oxalobacteraceae bacterium R-40]|uniref:PA0069 family radical SAM protein n=1 Tax=Keguizhuia sedimenti TaxID=3064264 RepID=A0ABU1BSM3_9BURK|nr:PA0069 family radical SAM protein [Oxalobacteraceae bacterium R-40]
MKKPERFKPNLPAKGRGAVTNERSRYEAWRREADGEFIDSQAWSEEAPPKLKTVVWLQQAKSIIATNASPDIPFDASINPYQGCEHGCIYCYARPTHAYLGHSPGLDFETKLYAKENAAALLEKELAKPSYVPKLIVLGANTDPYQPIEREHAISRSILDIMDRHNHPVAITTKSGLITRDIDILSRLAANQLVRVYISVTSLNNDVSRTLEPRASSPARRLDAIRKLSEAGIPTGVLIAPVIPGITDVELEAIVEAIAAAGAASAAYIPIRLPREVADLFTEWLQEHYPLRAKHVEHLISEMRGGQLYDSAFGTRMTGTGVFADLLRQRFQLACKRHGINAKRELPFRTDLFSRPANTSQLSLF